MVFVFLSSIFSVSAADEGLDVNNFGYTASYVAPGAPSSTDITNEITKQIPSSGDIVRFDFPTLNTTPGVAASTYMTLNLLDGFVIRPDHEYTMSFVFGNRMQVRSKLDVYVIIYNSNGSQYGSKAVYSFDGICANSTQTADFNFKIKSSELPDGYRTSLKLVYQSFWTNTSNAVPERFYISRYISIVDNDDNTGLLQQIISAIKAIPSNISSFFSNLGDRIGNFFADIKQRMIDSYNGLVYNLTQFKDGVKSWFTSLGDRISGFFDDLKLKIETKIQAAVDEVKSWFIPSDGYFEEYKTEWETWARERFGVLIQIPDLFIDLFRRLGNLMTFSSYTFTFPEISVPIDGKTYVFVNEQTVDMSYWLNSQTTTKYLYDVYGICVFAVFAFALLKYTAKVQKDIFEG